jgi:hypothetical protein
VPWLRFTPLASSLQAWGIYALFERLRRGRFGSVGLVNSYTVSAAKCSYARMPGVADSRRGADVNLHHPTSLSKELSVPRGLALSSFYLQLCTSCL